MMVHLEVAIEGCFPARTGQPSLSVEVPVCQLLVCELIGKLTKPIVDVKRFARGQTRKHNPRALNAIQCCQAHGGAIDAAKAVFPVNAN